MRYLLALTVLLTGCVTPPPPVEYKQIQNIPLLEHKEVKAIEVTAKPKSRRKPVYVTEGGSVHSTKVDGSTAYVMFDKDGLDDLIDIYNEAQANKELVQRLNVLNSDIIQERNRVRDLAVYMEYKTNILELEASKREEERRQDERSNLIESTILKLIILGLTF